MYKTGPGENRTDICSIPAMEIRHNRREECTYSLMGAGLWTTQQTYVDILHRPIDMEEIRHVLQGVRRNKTPGSDGIGWEFYKATWSTIKDDLYTTLNEMYMEKTITSQQKQGIIVCLPKHNGAQTPRDFRPITLLNVDYKILARIIVNRLCPLLAEHLLTYQFCGVPGNTILDAIATVRDTTAMAEVTQTPLCVVSLDFQEAFDRISHLYLYTNLRIYGLSEWFVDRIKTMYDNAHSLVQVNGHIAGPIPIRCSIRQECLLSVVLFALCIHPVKTAGPKLPRRTTTMEKAPIVSDSLCR